MELYLFGVPFPTKLWQTTEQQKDLNFPEYFRFISKTLSRDILKYHNILKQDSLVIRMKYFLRHFLKISPVSTLKGNPLAALVLKCPR